MTLAALAAVALAASDGGVEFYSAFEGRPGDAGVTAGWLEPVCAVEEGGGLGLDGGWSWLGPGCFLPASACLEKGKRGAALEAELAELRGAPHDFSFRELLKAAWVGYALGALSAIAGIGALCWAVTGSPLCR